MNILKPSMGKICDFSVFLVKSIVGYVVSLEISQGSDVSREHDVIQFWEIWVFSVIGGILALSALLILPLYHAITFFGRIFGTEDNIFDGGPLWAIWIVQVLYFYAISCLLVTLWSRLRKKIFSS